MLLRLPGQGMITCLLQQQNELPILLFSQDGFNIFEMYYIDTRGFMLGVRMQHASNKLTPCVCRHWYC